MKNDLIDVSDVDMVHTRDVTDEGRSFIRLGDLRELLQQMALHIVTDADKRVLDAMAGVDEIGLDMIRDFSEEDGADPLKPAVVAELARRLLAQGGS